MTRQIGLPSAVAFIVGPIIGTGIFIAPKGVLEGTGSVGASMLVWTGSGVVAMLAALCYVELGTMIPLSGGEFPYLMESLGPVPAFLSVWIKIMADTADEAIVALNFSQYILTPFLDDCRPPKAVQKMLASAVMLTVAIVNCYSVKLAARVQVVFTATKVLALGVIIGGGVVKLVQGNTQYISTGFEGTVTNPSVFVIALYNGLYAYSGWNTLNYLTEELINPIVNLPRALWISIPLVTAIYLLTNIAYLTVMSKEDILVSPAVALSWGEIVLGSASILIPFVVACSTFSSLNGASFATARVWYVAGRAGHFPTLLSYVNIHHLTPWCSVIFTTAVTIVLIVPGDISSLLNFFSFLTWTMHAAVFCGLIVMRFTRRHWHRPYKVPIVIPVIMVLVSAYLVIAPIVDNPQIEFLYSGLFLLSGLVFYVVFVHFRITFRCLDSLTVWIQLFLQVAPSKYEP